MQLRTVHATRYVTPLREGGSLPAIIEADDDGMYVLKFRGAGQGPKALIAEVIAGEIARLIGLPVPEIVLVELDGDMARTEPDEEIQDLIRASDGLNLALDYLPGSVTFDPVVESPDETLASSIVWFDAFMTNVDRTPKNPNMLMWHKKLWLIDHGACLYFHHAWNNHLQSSRDRFSVIKNHVLLPFAGKLEAVADELREKVTRTAVEAIVSMIPEGWLLVDAPFDAVDAHREAYVQFLMRRLEPPFDFLEEAARARSMSV